VNTELSISAMLLLRATAMLSLVRMAPLQGRAAVCRAVARPSGPARAPMLARMMCAEAAPSSIAGFKTTFTVLKSGDAAGPSVTKGSAVTVHATGVVVEKFWSTKDPGQQPFSYTAGVGMVITGWDQGLLGMTVGEERKVTIPAEEGYGEGGFPQWGIPAGGTLEFTLEVLSIE
jgi:peptidylprolyl isomerase